MTHQPPRFTAAFAADRGRARGIPTAAAGGLGSLELEVVEIARWDGPSSVNPEGLLARFGRSVLGLNIARPLADPRLEALRRFSATAWFRNAIREKDLRALFAAGFSWNDAWRVVGYVGSQLGRVPAVEICRR